MKKKYNLPEENPESNVVREPAIEYGIEEEIKILPLTEEDLKNCITGDELRERMYKFIDELFDRDENNLHTKN